ncbi:MAG TPA: DUF2089 domain-containing protein [Anaerolineales bacterium]|nr:DUF2089 domain-containing protein [Anaerolineae bacterium]HIP87658.1 DUF2089 domain-containing protein [Anaerolineales bacterium]
MYPVPTECPVCHDDLLVTRLVCRKCGTALEGRFTMGRLAQLTPDQLHFVEVFLRCEGKITRVQEELGISYPTVRSRLEEVIRALGYEVGKDQADLEERRQEVLERLARREITSEEALRLLQETR